MTTLATYLNFSNGKKRPSHIGAIPVYGGNGILDYTDRSNNENCLVIGRVGAYCGSVYYASDACWVSDNAIAAKPIGKNSLRFFYYLLQSLHLQKRQIGTSQPLLTQGVLNAITCDAPGPIIQNKIAAVLSILDSKITLNNRLNDYLAELGVALFNNTCPQTNDPNAVLSDVAEITMGQSPSGSSYNEDGDGEVFYQGRGEFGTYFPRRRLSTTEPKRMAQEGDTLMSVRAPVGDLNVANEKCCIGRGLAAIHSNSAQSFVHYLMYGQARQLDAFNGDGTVFGSINGKALKELPVFLPDGDAIISLDTQLSSIDAMIRRNDDETQALEQLRETLLPKLMSGKIDVSQLDLMPLNI